MIDSNYTIILSVRVLKACDRSPQGKYVICKGQTFKGLLVVKNLDVLSNSKKRYEVL